MEDLTERPKGEPVHNLVDHFCGFRSFKKMVGVYPLFIRTPYLNVNKSAGWIPQGDQGEPSEGDTIESQTIIDTGSLTHLNRRRREDSKAKLWGRNSLEVQSVRKESENAGSRERYDR